MSNKCGQRVLFIAIIFIRQKFSYQQIAIISCSNLNNAFLEISNFDISSELA
jgi:hypothetical protein